MLTIPQVFALFKQIFIEFAEHSIKNNSIMKAAVQFQFVQPIYNTPMNPEPLQIPKEEQKEYLYPVQEPQLGQGSILNAVNQHRLNQQQVQPLINDINRYFNVVPCARIQLNPDSHLGANHVYAVIPSHTLVEGKLLERSYVEYQVKLVPGGQEVSHRYKNFEVLQNYLSAVYTEFIVPPLPKKTGDGSKKPEVRMVMLERFLNRLLGQLEFRTDPAVELFFVDKDRFNTMMLDKSNHRSLRFQRFVNRVVAQNEFKIDPLVQIFKDKQDVEKDSPNFKNIDISQLASPTGTVTLQVSSQIDSYLDSVKENIKPQAELVRKIRKQTKVVMDANTKLSTELKNLANLHSSLFFNIYENQKSGLGKNLNGEGVNIALNNMYLRWSQKLEEQNGLFKKHVLDFYKFNMREYEGVSEIIEKQKTLAQKVNAQQAKLLAEKTKLFESRNVDKWEISPATMVQVGAQQIQYNKDLAFVVMLPQKTQDAARARDNLGYIGNKVFEQVIFTADCDARDAAANFLEFAVKQRDLLEQPHFWNDVIQAMNTFKLN